MIQSKRAKNFGTISIGGKSYDIFIAKSEELKKRGLLNFISLPLDEGMLFVINESEPEETNFHMHNVPFPLEMVFMDDDFNVLDVKRGNPEDDLIKGIASYVLEVNIGSGIKPGDKAEEIDDDDSHEYVMKILDLDGKPLGLLKGGERIISRKESIVLIKKALKANVSGEDKDYKALGKYMFKVLKGLDSRKPEYVEAPKGKEE